MTGGSVRGFPAAHSQGGSGALTVTHGVVQGSIMGPVLFMLLSNDLTQHVPHLSCTPTASRVQLADDTQFIDADLPKNLPELKHRVEETPSAAL